ncbi:MAG TPA: ABC transporter permease subunit [Trebonia sp.]|nr:ABC transporter permease subunit [Trebonia sp.]
MNWQNVATIARKDLTIMMTRRSLRIGLVILPLGLAILFSEIISRASISALDLPKMLNAFLFFFMIYTGALPATIASYSLVGEKVERSLEPLLATPASDGEILLGKALAALVPPLVAMWAGMITLMTLCDVSTHGTLGYLYFPNWMAAVVVFACAPLLALMAVGFAVWWSSRVSEVRTAQQLGALAAIPGAGLYIALVTGAFTLDLTSLVVICGALAVVDVTLAFLARATFHREEILTRWA